MKPVYFATPSQKKQITVQLKAIAELRRRFDSLVNFRCESMDDREMIHRELDVLAMDIDVMTDSFVAFSSTITEVTKLASHLKLYGEAQMAKKLEAEIAYAQMQHSSAA
jgi:hypothetical protein